MLYLSLFYLLILAFINCDVFVLDNKSFEYYFNKFDYNLVLVYKGKLHSDTQNEFVLSEQVAAKSNINVNFLIIDLNTQSELAKMFDNIDKFPKQILFYKKEQIPFTSKINQYEIVSELQWRTDPILIFKTGNDLQKFMDNKEIVIFFGESDSFDNKYEIFVTAARHHLDILIGTCPSEACLSYFGFKNNDVVFFKSIDNKREKFQDIFVKEKLISFISSLKTPVFDTFTVEASRNVFGIWSAGVFLFRDSKNDDYIFFDSLMKRVSRNMKKILTFVVTDLNTNDIEKELSRAMRVTEKPSLYIFDARKEEILSFRFEGNQINEHSLTEFIKSFARGELKAIYESEEPIIEQTYPVKTLVGKNYNKYIEETEKDIFAYLYVDDCIHCENLSPVFQQLAKLFSERTDEISFVKVNMSKNEIPNLNISGLPYLRFYPNYNKDYYEDYLKEDRSLDSLFTFIKTHTTIKDININLDNFKNDL